MLCLCQKNMVDFFFFSSYSTFNDSFGGSEGA